MPVSRISFNLDILRFVTGDGNTLLTQLESKKRSKRKYEMSILQGGVAQDLPDGTTMEIAVKDPAALTTNFLADASGTRGGWGYGSRWYFFLDLDTAEMAARIATAKDPTTLAIELLITFPDGQLIQSSSLPFLVENNIIRGTEGGATVLPSSVAWMYRPDITSLANLCAVQATTTLADYSIVEFVVVSGGSRTRVTVQLVPDSVHAYDAGDPGHGRPADSATRHWEVV